MESVVDERDQAEQVKVRAAGRGPASEQDIEADTQVDERDEAQAGIERAIASAENERHLDRNAAAFKAVIRLRPGAHAVHCAAEFGDGVNVAFVDGNDDVARSDAGFVARTGLL